MNLFESHRWVIIRLSIITIILAAIAFLIDNYAWSTEMNPFYTISLWAIVISNVIAIITFFFLKPIKDFSEEEYKDQVSFGKLSRNIYLFSLLMLLTGLMTFSSTAGRVSYFFFLMGLITMPLAHIIYGAWIKKLNTFN